MGTKTSKTRLPFTQETITPKWVIKDIDPREVDWSRTGKYNEIVDVILDMKMNSSKLIEKLALEGKAVGSYIIKQVYNKNIAREGTAFVLRHKVLGESISFLKTNK